MPPDTAAIIVITTAVPDFVDFAVLEFNCFVAYEIHDDGQANNLQNFVGKISIGSDIFYDAKFLVTFERNNGECPCFINIIVESKIEMQMLLHPSHTFIQAYQKSESLYGW